MDEILNTLPANAVVGAMAVYMIEWIKRQAWFPWVTTETKRLNALVNAGVAFAASIGVTAQFDAAAGELVIRGLTWAVIGHGVWEFAKQWTMQQAAYDFLVRKGQ